MHADMLSAETQTTERAVFLGRQQTTGRTKSSSVVSVSKCGLASMIWPG